MQDANGEDLEIILNTPGGFVSEGSKIDELLLDYKKNNPNAQIMATVIEAQSYGSYILTNPAIDMVVTRQNAIVMIHNPLMGAIGDYKEMKKAADILERRAALFAERYANRMKKPIEEIRSMMDEETYFIGGKEIIDAGLASEIIDELESIEDKMSLRAKAEIKMDNLKIKIKNTKEDFEKIAAMTKDYNKIVDNNIEDNNMDSSIMPAESGVNKQEDFMDKEKLLSDHPEVHAEIMKAGEDKGKAEEKKRINDLFEMKNKKDFEGIGLIQNRIDEAILSGETVEDVKLAIHAMSLKSEVAAAMDTNEIGEVKTKENETVSGEKMKEEDNRRVF